MNLEDVIDPEYGLQQDEWSLTKPTFGEEGQLQVIGWSGKRYTNRFYILRCSKCVQDSELFGEGVFKSMKTSLVVGGIPCGCSQRVNWSQEQSFVLCCRKAKELGHIFVGFEGDWKGQKTKITMLCEKHGKWSSGTISRLVNGNGCPGCGSGSGSDTTIKAVRKANTKSDDVMIKSFHDSNAFHPDTKFWRSERLDSQGYPSYWHMFCAECTQCGESRSSDLQQGRRPCSCSPMRQKECYINWLIDDNHMTVAIKFGIANNSKQRVKQQDTKSVYFVRQYQVYSFPSVAACKQAERECKKELETGVVLKRDMPDGWTETTWSYNIGKVKSIYKRNGGVLV